MIWQDGPGDSTSRPALDGRTALITGGGKGIGRSIALGLAADGAAVAITWVNDEAAADKTVRSIEAGGGRARAYRLAVEVWPDVEATVEQVRADFDSVDIVVNNGALTSPGRPVVDTDPGDAQRVLLVNAMGAYFVSRAALPGMRERGQGDIVMISSRATVEPASNRAAYAMAKAALESLAVSLALEERAYGIRVNTVAPGFVDTEIGRTALQRRYGVESLTGFAKQAPFGRFCSVEDIAAVVRFLVSKAGGYITGQRIGVDGGGTSHIFGSTQVAPADGEPNR